MQTTHFMRALAAAAAAAHLAAGQELVGIDFPDGDLFAMSATEGTIELIGSTGVDLPLGLETGADGTTYLLALDMLYRLDLETLQATPIGPINVSLFEGGLAIAPDGRAYAVNGFNATSARLYELDLQTGITFLIGTIGGGEHDVNGLVWREDGRLVGLDRITNGLLVIDPIDASVEATFPLGPTVGSVGGMTVRNGVGYLSTSGTGGSIPGSNELLQVNLYNGNVEQVLELDGVSSVGIAGLASGPSLTPTVYCTAKTNSLGCLPAISSTGIPSASASGGFVVAASEVRNGKLGVGCYSTNGADAMPFQGGLLCMRPPVLRTPAFVSRGAPPPVNDCSGVYRIDMNAFAAGLLGGSPAPELSVPGTSVQFQFWGRDKPASSGSSLSDALGYTVGM